MTIRYGLQVIYLRLSPASCKAVKALRGEHHVQFLYPSNPIAILYNIIHAPENDKIVSSALKEVSSSYGPLDLQLQTPHRTHRRGGDRKSVNVTVASTELLRLRAGLMERLRDARALARYKHGGVKLLALKEHPVEPPFRARISICHKLLPYEADNMVQELDIVLKDTTMSSLTAVGLSLGPAVSVNRTRELGQQVAPWVHFPFSGNDNL